VCGSLSGKACLRQLFARAGARAVAAHRDVEHALPHVAQSDPPTAERTVAEHSVTSAASASSRTFGHSVDSTVMNDSYVALPRRQTFSTPSASRFTAPSDGLIRCSVRPCSVDLHRHRVTEGTA